MYGKVSFGKMFYRKQSKFVELKEQENDLD